MTGRTHDLAAFTALSIIVATQPIPSMSLATGIAALGACFIGGLAPDIDQPTAALWNRIPAGGVFGRIFSPFLGGHRYISHSILGVILFGLGLKWLLALASTVVLVDMGVVWWAFMIGFVSHLLMDTTTRDGVPWLFPMPIRFGFPPLRNLRVITGGFMEKVVIFPALLFVNAYIYYTFKDVFLEYLRFYVK